MNEKKLRQLIQLLQDADLEEIEVEHSFWRGTRVKLVRDRGPRPQLATAPVRLASAAPSTPAPDSAAENSSRSAESSKDGDLHMILAPMVGTAFLSPASEEASFVQPGDTVQPGQSICIVEAMKIMNEIESDIRGEIVEILITNGEPVEFNQPLVSVRPT